MDNTNQNAEGTSVDRQEPDDTLTDTSKVMEEDFEILDIREAEEPELAGELDGQERAMEVGHCEAGGRERAVEVGRCEAGGEESAVEVGHSETSGQETASDRFESRQEIGGDTLGIVGQDNWVSFESKIKRHITVYVSMSIFASLSIN